MWMYCDVDVKGERAEMLSDIFDVYITKEKVILVVRFMPVLLFKNFTEIGWILA